MIVDASKLANQRKAQQEAIAMGTQNRPLRGIVLRARLIGTPIFLRGDGSTVHLTERRHQALLAYLVVYAGEQLSRDSLADLLWPNSSAISGRASLRQALSVLKRALGREAAEMIDSNRERLLLHSDGLESDLGLQDAAIANRVFLDGLSGISSDFDTWRASEQAQLSERQHRWLINSAERAQDQGRVLDAMALLSRAIQIDPLDEATHRRLMALLLAQGRAGEALRQFQRLQDRLQTELGERPEQTTLDLVRDIRNARRNPHNLAPYKAPAPPPTRYARSGDCNIAFQVFGQGPIDLVLVPGWISNLDFAWTHPAIVQVYVRLGRFSRLIRFDKRGTGLSDRDVGFPSLAERMADLRAVMDAAGSRRAVLFGSSEGGNLCLLFAATHPERVAGLVLYGAYARGLWAPDYPWAKTEAELEEELAAIAREWGGPFDLGKGAPSFDVDEDERTWFAAYSRASASPQDAIKAWRWGAEVDQRAMLPELRVPTLVLHRLGDRWVKIEEGRFLAAHIPGAQLATFPGEDHLIWAGNSEPILAEVERFAAEL
jgi:pimeloyl-ACP methyl ester carboxylesterase/DNA-binding SARP family transcriptional activator